MKEHGASLAPELDEIRARWRAFAEDNLGGDAAERDKMGGYDPAAWKVCAAEGLLGICMPARLGGAGLPVSHAVAAFEGLSYGCRDGGFVYAMVSQLFGVQMPLAAIANPVIDDYLRGAVTGDLIMAHGFTEESAGSDAFSMQTKAEASEGEWLLTGRKTFITNAPEAHAALVFARTGDGRSPFDLSAFFVDLSWAGVSKGREFEKMGLRTVRMGELVFDGVRVPNDHLVGGKGRGLWVVTESTGWERAVLLTAALGPMGRVLNEVIDWAKHRTQFERPIGSFQQVSAKVADMIVRHKLCRMVIYDMASRLDRDPTIRPWMQDVAIAKLFVSENYVQFMLDAMQIFGARGYLYDWPIQQDVRDSLSSTIYAGTSETLRNTIAKLAGLPVS